MVTLQDVAVRAGVSVASVSYALNNKGNISDKTRNRILQAAKELNYKHKNETFQHSGVIGVLIANFSGPFYTYLLDKLSHAARKNGYHMIVYCPMGDSGNDDFFIDILRNTSMKGLIVLCSSLTDEILIRYGGKTFPIVTLDRVLNAEGINSVTVDNEVGTVQAISYLIECGHREIGFMGIRLDVAESRTRYRAYCKTLMQYNINPKTQLYCQGDHTEESGYNTTKILLAQNRIPNAMFFSNDEMAYGFIRACKEEDRSILERVSMVSFDDIDCDRNERLGLCSVRQPIAEVADTAVQLLVMSGNKNHSAQVTAMSSYLVKRASINALGVSQ